jgi:hypothetical protein
VSLYGQLVSAYKGFGYTGQQAQNIAAVQTVGEGAGLGSGGADAASGGSNGISQWSASRWSAGVSWMQGQGLDPRSVAGQAGWTNQELQTTYSGVNTNSVSDLVNNYESPQQNLRAGEIARSQAAAGAPSSLSMMTPDQSAAGMPGVTTGAQPGGGTGSQPGGSTGSQPGGSSGSQPGGSTPGAPVYLTDPAIVAQTGLTTVGTSVDAATKGLTADTATATAAGTSWFNFLGNLLSGGTGIFARVGVGMLALVLVIAGLWMAGKAQD